VLLRVVAGGVGGAAGFGRLADVEPHDVEDG
jgi:hypothetical protein